MNKHSRLAEMRTFLAVWQRESTCCGSAQIQTVRFFRMLCFATFCSIPFANTTGQQIPSATTNSKTQPVQPVSSSNTGLWKTSRPESNRQSSTEDVLQAEKVAVLEIEQPQLVPTPPRHRVADDMEFRQRESEEGFRDLRERISQLLERLQSQEPAAEAKTKHEIAVTVPEATVTVPEPAVTTPPNPDPAQAPGVSSVTLPPDGGDASTIPPSVPTSPVDAEPPALAATESIFADSMNAKAIVDGPVDRIGLADSLYALNELPIALEMYEKVDVKHVAQSERYWVSFQRACCLRKLKRIPEAQELYRRLAGQQSAGWLAEVSRWWLDQIDARVELETHIKEYDAILTALKESSDDRNGQ
jgi:hypothetical protein